ncbi:hypothetical protein UFOVP736_16 [uncultured Caudovirales phage]|uniref:Glycine-rich domain-containing protein n=1 Tax=uncultured Caudovirales phage TaxID=2100421 RepID=A0A6J7X183_9CAUD|nr:hypothetical protein UFOVP705_65 [uncultured Caudovirales phage]CAB5223886.1 hypothetical protein UFOVP736_16 [uncultured Caudovirales phage]
MSDDIYVFVEEDEPVEVIEMVERGLPGPPGEVTNAAVVAAIAEDPPAIREALDLDEVDNTADADKPISTAVAAALAGKQPVGDYATLVAGKVPASQLPSYVDDVIEVANAAALPVTGESGKLYVTIDNGKIFRWSGSNYVEIVSSPGSTDAVPEGANNLYHTPSRAAAAAPVQSVAGRTGEVVIGIADVPGLGAELDGKQPTGDYIEEGDSRLSDARTPTAHLHTAAQITDFAEAVAAAAPERSAVEVIADIDAEIGEEWKVGADTIVLAAADPLPTMLRDTYDQTVTVQGLGYDAGNPSFGDLVLLRAPDYNGHPAYTSDGSPVEHENNGSTTQSSLYVPIGVDRNILFHYISFLEYVTMETTSVYPPNAYYMASWTTIDASYGTLGFFDLPSGFVFPQVYLASTHRGQLARHGDAAPYRWFVATGFDGALAWQEFAATDSSGLIPTSKGGTGASTPAAALVNLGASAKVKTVVTEVDSFTLSSATHGDNWTRLTKPSGETTIALPSMSAGNTFDFMRVGAGTISFSGGTVENGAAIANVPVGGWLKLVSRGGASYDLVAFGSSSGGSRTDVFLASQSWTKPEGAKMFQYIVIGGGGGGGAGRRGLANTDRFGGGGGGAGAISMSLISATLLPSPITITVGAGGAGGVNSANSTNGQSGGAGGASFFGTLTAAGGTGGNGGTNAGGGGGSSTNNGCMIFATSATRAGGGSGNTWSTVTTPAGGLNNPTGGGGGSGFNTANATTNGGNGGPLGQTQTGFILGGTGGSGTGGANGGSGQAGYSWCGTGGGGGRPNTTSGAGYTGGDGGPYGGGGGGGSGALDGAGGSTAGGNGSAGVVVVTTYF